MELSPLQNSRAGTNLDLHFCKAWDVENSKVVDVRELPMSRNGKNCQCVCVECNGTLEACQGSIRKWYFRHQSRTECNGGPMTAIHLLAQFLLNGNRAIKTQGGLIDYSDGISEYNLPGSSFRADVAGKKHDGALFLVEITVTHAVDSLKEAFYRESKVHSIEIDLSRIDPEITEAELQRRLLNDLTIQRMIFEPAKDPSALQNSEKGGGKSLLEELIPWGIGALIVSILASLTSDTKK